MHLIGARACKLDAKARLTLPADIRKEFGNVVCLVPLKEALYGFTPEGHEAWVAAHFPNGYNDRSHKDQQLRRSLNGLAVTVEIDSVGRVSLGKIDAGHRERLGIDRDVQVVGNEDHFEIWNAEAWQRSQEEFSIDDLEALMFDD